MSPSETHKTPIKNCVITLLLVLQAAHYVIGSSQQTNIRIYPLIPQSEQLLAKIVNNHACLMLRMQDCLDLGMFADATFFLPYR